VLRWPLSEPCPSGSRTRLAVDVHRRRCPNQTNRGAHINVSGGGVLKHAPNKAAAIQFLEYLASSEAQEYFANGNNEYPASTNTIASNPALKGMGDFKRETLNVTVLGKNQALAQQIYDRAGWK
jgi:iron(III) transport system substrate-binding protein